MAVTSWRDSASRESQDDLDGLLNVCLPFGQQMLDRQGEFFPYGAVISVDGEAKVVAGDLGHGERPASDEVISTILEGFRRDRTHLRAIALIIDVHNSDSDAIRVDLEHREGHALAVLLPYKKRRFGRGIEYGPLKGSTASQRVWPDR